MIKPSKKNTKKQRVKGALLIMLRSSNKGTPILQKRRFGGILYWCDWGAPFLLLFWSSVTTPLLKLCYYTSLIRVSLEHLCYIFSRALLLNPIGANWINYSIFLSKIVVINIYLNNMTLTFCIQLNFTLETSCDNIWNCLNPHVTWFALLKRNSDGAPLMENSPQVEGMRKMIHKRRKLFLEEERSTSLEE